MSDLRPEFRPLTFPRPAEQAVSETEAAVHAHAGAPPCHSVHQMADCDGELDDEDDIWTDQAQACEQTHAVASETDPIAGRIAPTTGEPTPGELVEMLLRLGQRLRGHLDGRFGTFGLSDARFAALSVIREAAPAGCTQAHLATKLGQCESSISTLVERMRASRLLYRLRAKADRRKRVLMLTDDGRQLFEQGLAARDREAEALFSRLSDEEQRQLAMLLGRLFSTLDRIGESVPERTADRPAA
jgi:MarR family transcriptional regulator for hemolysin